MEKILQLFTGTSELPNPFIQHGKIIATNSHILIFVDVEDYPLLAYKEQKKPDLRGFLRDFETDKVYTLDAFKKQLKPGKIKEVVKEDCMECDGEGYLECDLGHDHDCEDCNGKGVVDKKTGRMVINENEYFVIDNQLVSYKYLRKLIDVCELMGEDKILKKSNKENVRSYYSYFKIGNATILIMSVLGEISDQKKILPNYG